jgi:hypothetical protein
VCVSVCLCVKVCVYSPNKPNNRNDANNHALGVLLSLTGTPSYRASGATNVQVSAGGREGGSKEGGREEAKEGKNARRERGKEGEREGGRGAKNGERGVKCEVWRQLRSAQGG